MILEYQNIKPKKTPRLKIAAIVISTTIAAASTLGGYTLYRQHQKAAYMQETDQFQKLAYKAYGNHAQPLTQQEYAEMRRLSAKLCREMP